jgi:hypothetical protein
MLGCGPTHAASDDKFSPCDTGSAGDLVSAYARRGTTALLSNESLESRRPERMIRRSPVLDQVRRGKNASHRRHPQFQLDCWAPLYAFREALRDRAAAASPRWPLACHRRRPGSATSTEGFHFLGFRTSGPEMKKRENDRLKPPDQEGCVLVTPKVCTITRQDSTLRLPFRLTGSNRSCGAGSTT